MSRYPPDFDGKSAFMGFGFWVFTFLKKWCGGNADYNDLINNRIMYGFYYNIMKFIININLYFKIII